MPKELISLCQLSSLPSDEFNQTMTDVNLWILENLTHGVDYEWSIASFTYTDKTGYNEYPYGLFINNDSDRTAFKIRFNL